MTGADLPRIVTAIPGPRSERLVDVLAQHECPAVTHRRARRASELGLARVDPIVWDEAVGANVRDADNNVFVDFTSGFGVALVGHRDPEVVAAAHNQAHRLVHAMGDAFSDVTRIELLEALAGAAPPGLSVAILGLSGSDSVDAAVRTAMLATGRVGVLAFAGAYHGLALGVAGLQAYQPAFTSAFAPVLHPKVNHLPWNVDRAALRQVLDRGDVGMVLVEPILGRGGFVEPAPGWLVLLHEEAHRAGALLCVDEVQTGLGRTGATWASVAEGVVADLLCTGKALGGGYPISACVGRPDVMASWGASAGEALLTQTFLGHPIGCATARVVLRRVAGGLAALAQERGAALTSKLSAAGFAIRGRGLMRAATVPAPLATCRRLLERGFLALPAGADAVGLMPPVCVTDAQLSAFVSALSEAA